jgi:epoxide hydrolase 4
MILHNQYSRIQVNDIHLHVVQAGPQDGPPVILLHGFPEFWYGWRAQIPALAQAGFRVIVPDQRGYNQSDKPRRLSEYRLDVLAADVVGLMTALGYERAPVVGHDWGGIAAWTAAALYPQRIERLGVINAPYPPIVARTLLRHPEQLLKSAYITFFQIPFLPEAMLRNANWKLLVETMRRSSRPGTFSDADFEHYRQAWWRKGAMTSMLNWYRALVRRPLRMPLEPQFSMPVMLLWGLKDIALGPELAQASIDLCDQGQAVFYDEATHWVQHEIPDQVNAELIQFLRS